ncbi:MULTISPECIES: ATP-grasp domain-containing protein [unclassified Pseudodesulfovibrio]|uniref:ATP-grasp domain-containing protein n=1 Tax=unclassified Pseudodesulfovibrio TaxID=2661612 RepID=UPI000FEBB31F|nr:MULTISPECIES: ATP-grasp domain-containing protein [unclassified Pseudodesulfovibrio]MCJ2166241.1 ATP-grasp domain-containing protein [Pseudodesulfovibrio sp. S3-i]RWU02273.1 ATP-grasp domain-containing protein [Pseudodesulfovibrio sp. S3]
MNKHKGPCVLVTGTGGGGLGEQLVKALRLADVKYHLVATDVTEQSAGISRGDAWEILPPASAPGYFDALMSVCVKHNVEVLLPGSEAEMKVLSERRDDVAGQGLFMPMNSRTMISLCSDKVQFFEKMNALGIEIPWFRSIRKVKEVESLPSYPAVFKPSVGSGGSANTFIVQSPDEGRMIASYLCTLYPEFIAQEYVGQPDSEYTVGVLSDLDGQIINSIAVKRNTLSALSCRFKAANRTGRKDLGDMLVISSGISQGEIGPFPEVTGPCEAIAQKLGSIGPCNIQLRLMDGKIYLFEINPRFSGTTSLRAMVGFNEPDLLIRRHLLREEIEPRFDYDSGVIMRRLEETIVTGKKGVSA